MSKNSESLKHFGLGSLTRALKVPSTSELKHYGKLGAGVVAGRTIPGMVLSRLPIPAAIPNAAMPFIATAIGVIGGGIASKKLDKDFGNGMMAGAASIAAEAVINMVLSRVAPSVAAETEAVSGLRGLRGARGSRSLYGVGTPDVSAARMFAGAPVAMEEVGGPMAGATIQFEPTSSFAGSLN